MVLEVFRTPDTTIPPYLVGGKKFKTLSGLNRAITNKGGYDIKPISESELRVTWRTGITKRYAVEVGAGSTRIQDLHYDLL
jgi:hypothetical protein